MNKMGRKNKGSTLIIGGIILVLLVFLVVILIKNGNKDNFKEDYEDVEQNIVDKLLYLTSGYNTDYFGTEKLFEKSSLKFKNLNDENILATAISVYNMEKDEESEEEATIDSEKLANYDTYILVKGSVIQDYIKKVFNIDWTHKSVKGTDGFIYNFDYDDDSDTYIVYPSDTYKEYEEKLDSFNSSIVVEPISSVSTSKAVKTTIAIAYSNYTDNEDGTMNIKYYKDKDQKDLVFEVNSNDLYKADENNNIIENPDVDSVKKHSKEFQKYVVTSTKTDDGFALTSMRKK